MAEERKVAFVMQARLNSQRVPNKMLKPFAGTTLFDIAMRKAVESGIPKQHVFFALGDKPLIDEYNAYFNFAPEDLGYNLIYRSEESCNATNDPNKPDSLKLLYEWYEELMRYGYTHVVLFNPCHPLVKPETINLFYESFSMKDWDGMFTVTESRNYYWTWEGEPMTDWRGDKLMNTRKVKPIHEAAHVLYGSKLSFIEDECWMGDTSPPKPHLFTMNKKEAFDVDTLEDFEMAEAIYKADERV